jgi:hypothetical protein
MKSDHLPILITPSRICAIPVTAIKEAVNIYPSSRFPFPNSSTAPAMITISPAAGPLIANSDPLIKPINSPAIIEVSTPIIGGKLLAEATPRHSGNAINETMKPDTRSKRKFCFKLSFEYHENEVLLDELILNN